MQQQSLARRVEKLEEEMATLRELPAQLTELTPQFLQFRDEVRAEFSALREQLREEIRCGDNSIRREMRVLHEDLVARIALLQEGRWHRKSAKRKS